jgi:hypothetical protein
MSVLNCFPEQKLWTKPLSRYTFQATGWTTEKSRFDSQQGQEIFLSSTASRPALGPTQFPTQCVLGILSSETKRPRFETNHSPPANAEVKNVWSYNSTPLYVFMSWRLIKRRDNFTLQLEEESKDDYRADHSATVGQCPVGLYMGKLRSVEAAPSKVKREVGGSRFYAVDVSLARMCQLTTIKWSGLLLGIQI